MVTSDFIDSASDGRTLEKVMEVYSLEWNNFIAPMLFIFGGGEGSWFQVCILLPLFLLVISYWMKQQQMQNL